MTDFAAHHTSGCPTYQSRDNLGTLTMVPRTPSDRPRPHRTATGRRSARP